MQENDQYSAGPRPLSVTVSGWMLLVAGIAGVAYHAPELGSRWSAEIVGVLALRLLAILIGTFILRGAYWARMLAIAWMAYHVALSAAHSVSETAVHLAVSAALTYALYRPAASAYFRSRRRAFVRAGT